MRDINVSGGTAHITINEQARLPFESRTQSLTIKLTATEKDRLEAEASRRGKATSDFLRQCIARYLKLEHELVLLRDHLTDTLD